MPLLDWLREAFCLCLYLAASVWGYLFPLGSVLPRPTEPSPVVFVHGWMTQNPLYFRLKRRLERAGLRVYMTDFGVQLADLRRLARRLATYIDERELSGVVLVGASAGALVSLSYVQELGGWKKVRKLFGLGGPFFGSPLARLAFFSPAARQMRTGSRFLRELHSKPLLNPDRIVCLSAKRDEFVPAWSSRLTGTLDLEIDTVGHAYLQAFSLAVCRAILEEIGTSGHFRPGRPTG